MEDRQIIKLLFDRAESALEALSQRFGPRLYATAMNILSDPSDAEECVNDTYLALWNAIPPERPDPLCAYTYRVGRNIALKRLRGNTAQKRGGGYDLSLDELASCIPDRSAEDALDARTLGRSINAFLAAQPREDRVLFLRRYWFGDSVRDTAQALGLRENTASVRLNRLKSRLKAHLIKEGFFL